MQINKRLKQFVLQKMAFLLKNKLLMLSLLFILPYPNYVLSALHQSAEVSKKIDTIFYLNQMHDAVNKKNYTIIFINSVKDKLNRAYEYRHVTIKNKSFARLLYLDGEDKEVVLKDNVVSYYQQNHTPFSINSPRIIDVFPDVVFNNFGQLNQYYDYIPMGKARVTNRIAQLIRIIPKNKDRNNYMIWLDEKSFMPLRIDLYDSNHQLLQQFKVVSFENLTEKELFFHGIKKTKNYPVLAVPDKSDSSAAEWQLTWLPSGFSEKAHSQTNYKQSDIDMRLYSDGVFSFTVNISDNPSTMQPHSLQSGYKFIYITYLLNKEITIIGDLPLDTIKKIANHIEIKTLS